ncbi:MAG: hypothetical protein ABSG13_19220 [Bryobacteraceae bacterium]|jgi:hypothetical protein
MSAEVLSFKPGERLAYGQSEKARAFVAELREKLRLDDPASQRLGDLLGEFIDELDECRAALIRDGQFVRDRFGKLKLHPACQREIAISNEFGKTYRLLGIDQASKSDQGDLFD